MKMQRDLASSLTWTFALAFAGGACAGDDADEAGDNACIGGEQSCAIELCNEAC